MATNDAPYEQRSPIDREQAVISDGMFVMDGNVDDNARRNKKSSAARAWRTM